MSNFLVTSSPHIRQEEDTHVLMRDVILALLPVLVMSIYLYGFRAAIVTAVSIVSCVLFELLFELILHKPITVGDLSAALTGLLLAYNLPPTIPLFIPVIGAFFAIIIVKQLFGGIGSNFVNPALAARVFLFSWSGDMTTWKDPILSPLENIAKSADAVTTVTPLATLKTGELPAESLLQMLLGNYGGCIGETSALLLLLGGLYLLAKKVITWHTPVAYLGTVALLTYILSPNADRLHFMLYSLLSGGLMLGAIFMATDYASTPINWKGRLIFGIGCGLLTVLIRFKGGYPEGVSFSILIMNLTVWFIDKWTRPRVFGGGAAHGKTE